MLGDGMCVIGAGKDKSWRWGQVLSCWDECVVVRVGRQVWNERALLCDSRTCEKKVRSRPWLKKLCLGRRQGVATASHVWHHLPLPLASAGS